MNFRLTAVLFGATLVVGVVLLILAFTGDDKSVPTEVLLEELAAVKPDQIDTVEMEREDGSKLKLVRLAPGKWDAEWEVAAPGGGKQTVKARADASAVTQ